MYFSLQHEETQRSSDFYISNNSNDGFMDVHCNQLPLVGNKDMNVYIILFAAILFEVLGTMLLPASQNFSKILPTSILIISYVISFYMLAIVSQKLPLSVVYASWSGIGIFSIAILSYIFYKQSLNWQTMLGLFLIVLGVTIVNIYKAQSI